MEWMKLDMKAVVVQMEVEDKAAEEEIKEKVEMKAVVEEVEYIDHE